MFHPTLTNLLPQVTKREQMALTPPAGHATNVPHKVQREAFEAVTASSKSDISEHSSGYFCGDFIGRPGRGKFLWGSQHLTLEKKTF